MFQTYQYKDISIINQTNTRIYVCEIIDSDFNHQIKIIEKYPLIISDPVPLAIACAIIKTYESKNLDVVKNLFLLNLYICKKYGDEMHYLLCHQKRYINKYYDVDFNKYYDDLVNYTNKMMVII